MMKITVKELMEEKKAVDLMTPGGFVYLTAEQVNNILEEKITEINSNAGVRGCNMPMDIEELLSYKIVRGGYNPETDANEYLVE